MGYIAKKPLMSLDTGEHWSAGSRLSDNAMPQARIDALLAEGAIERVVETEPEPKPVQAKRKAREVPDAKS